MGVRANSIAKSNYKYFKMKSKTEMPIPDNVIRIDFINKKKV